MPTRSARRLYALMGVKISRAEVPGKEAGSAEPSSASAKRGVYLQARKKMPGMAGHFVLSVTTNGRHPPERGIVTQRGDGSSPTVLT